MIGKINSLLQEFHYTSPNVTMKLLSSYVTSFYGSQLWDIQSPECDRIFKAWNVMVRNVYHLDRCTHRYFVEPISGYLHPRTMLASRLVKFYRSCCDSYKLVMRLLVHLVESDNRTVLRRTLTLLLRECNLNNQSPEQLTPNILKTSCKYAAIPQDETWRLNLVKEIMDTKLAIPEFDKTELKSIMKCLCAE